MGKQKSEAEEEKWESFSSFRPKRPVEQFWVDPVYYILGQIGSSKPTLPAQLNIPTLSLSPSFSCRLQLHCKFAPWHNSSSEIKVQNAEMARKGTSDLLCVSLSFSLLFHDQIYEGFEI